MFDLRLSHDIFFLEINSYSKDESLIRAAVRGPPNDRHPFTNRSFPFRTGVQTLDMTTTKTSCVCVCVCAYTFV